MAARYYIVFIALCSIAWHCNGGITSGYVRKHRAPVCMPMEAMPPPPGDNTPEQVHITQGDYIGRSMIVSWVTPLEKYPNKVFFWAAGGNDKDKHSARATINFYRYYNYSSGYIHHAILRGLEYDTKYFYQIGSRRFFFTTPPEVGPDVPYTFGIMGDLGQTFDSNQTFEHYVSNPKGQTVLFAGDLSYADDHPFHDNKRWDSWGRFVEKSAAYQPWVWAAGNHELDFAPELGENRPFKPYMHRYHTPYMASNSTSPLWYSIKRASAYIIVLSSYSAYGKYTPQYQWLKEELPKVNRSETPWLIVVVHSPWYNSDNYHYMEGESMRVMFEPWLIQHKTDIVFAGHVHAYERTYRVSNVKYNITNRLCTPTRDINAPMYITIGDGGNIEGLADMYTDPQPDYSAFREASFGHAILEIKNRTHAHYTWHRNHDNEAVTADSTWLYNRYWFPEEDDA